MTSWSPDLDDAGPVYLAITRALESDIASQKLRGGDRLPTHRELAEGLGVNVGTVSRAYAEARRRGLIQGTVGRGTFVRRREASGLSHFAPTDEGGLLDLSVNVPVAMPAPDLAGALGALARSADLERIMAYQEPVGSREAREAGTDWLLRCGVVTDPDRLVVCAGAQHAILVALAAIAGPGDLILCEALTYPGFLGAARTLGLRVRGLEIDEEGLIPESLEEICRSDRPRLLYCMPTLQNPTCSQLPPERRRAIAGIAQRHDLMIVQDEIQLGMIDDAGPSLAELAPEHVFTIASLSKILSPGIRIAYLAGPASHAARLAELVWSSVWMTSPLCAELASRWIREGAADRMLALRRQAMKPRHRLVSIAFEDLAYHTRTAAYQVWLTLPEHWTAEAFAAALLGQGIRVGRADEFRANGSTAPNAVRISLSATPSLDDLERGLELIRRLHDASPPRSTLL